MHLHIDFNITHTLWIAGPLLLRSAIHHLYHKFCHHVIHTTGHKVHGFGRILARCKWLMDAILVACLAIFGAATEHEEHHASESEPEPHE